MIHMANTGGPFCRRRPHIATPRETGDPGSPGSPVQGWVYCGFIQIEKKSGEVILCNIPMVFPNVSNGFDILIVNDCELN